MILVLIKLTRRGLYFLSCNAMHVLNMNAMQTQHTQTLTHLE